MGEIFILLKNYCGGDSLSSELTCLAVRDQMVA